MLLYDLIVVFFFLYNLVFFFLKLIKTAKFKIRWDYFHSILIFCVNNFVCMLYQWSTNAPSVHGVCLFVTKLLLVCFVCIIYFFFVLNHSKLEKKTLTQMIGLFCLVSLAFAFFFCCAHSDWSTQLSYSTDLFVWMCIIFSFTPIVVYINNINNDTFAQSGGRHICNNNNNYPNICVIS